MTSLSNGAFYKNEDLHLKLGCGEDCPLLRPGYNVALWHTAQSASRQASRRFDSTFNLQTTFGFGLIDPPNRVELVDGELHGNCYIWVAKKPTMPHYHDNVANQMELTETVYHEMFGIFNDKQQSRFQPHFEPNFELLLWSAVGSRDAEVLQCALNLNRHIKTPPCIAMSMLCSAIDAVFDSAIPILLNRSRSGDPSRPLVALFRRFSINFFDLVNERPDAFATAHKLMTMYRRILVHYGAENCYRALHVDLLKCYHVISYLAIFDREETLNLIKALPQPLFVNEECSQGEETLLMTTYFDCALIKNTNVFLNAVLPLLRCGAIGYPDLLNFNPSTIESVQFEACNCVDFVRQQELAARLAVEMRQNSCHLNVKSLRHMFEKLIRHQQQHQQSAGVNPIQMDFFNYATFFEKRYPRSLLAHSRVAILRLLPQGFKPRSEAIKSLKLPSAMSDLLKFKDLEDLLHSFG